MMHINAYYLSHNIIFRDNLMTSSTIGRLRLRSVGRQQKNQCELCEHKFQLIINQEHQCKRCLRSICEKCVSGRVKIYGYQGQGASSHKCCLVCRYEEDFITSLIQENNVVFRTSSKISEEWLKRQNKSRQSFEKIVNEYEQKKWVTNDNIIRTKSQKIRINQLLYKQFNYSLKQFIGRVLESVRPEIVQSSLTNVLVAIYAELKNISYTPDLTYFVLFLLCFCNQSQCYFIVTRFIEKTFPQYQKLQSNRDSAHEFRTLIEMYGVLAHRPDRSQLKKVTVFFEQAFLNIVKPFTINCTNVSISFYLIDEMLTNNSYIYLYKGIAAMVYMCRDKLTVDGDPRAVYSYLVAGANLDKVKNNMISFERSNTKFQMVHEFFDSAEHRKLYEKYKLMENMNHKIEEKCRNLETSNEQLRKQLSTVSVQLDSMSFKKMALEEDLLKLADKVVLVEEVESLKNRNKVLFEANKQLESQIDLLTQKYEDLNKQYTIEEVTRKMYIKMQDQYEKEIVQLKTKNQLYEIQKLANNIDFETSYIDRKFEEKNNKIGSLQKENHQLRTELDFYRNFRERKQSSESLRNRKQSINDDFFGNISLIAKNEISYKPNKDDLDLSHVQLARDDPQGFKRLINAAKETIKKLKTDLENIKAEKELMKGQIKLLSQKLAVHEIQVQVVNQIREFINQIPDEADYLQDIELLQTIKGSESSIHKRTQLEKITGSFRKCYNEVKYRAMDSKLKQKKMKLYKKEAKTQEQIDGVDQNLTELLKWFGSTEDIIELNKKVLKKEEACLIM